MRRPLLALTAIATGAVLALGAHLTAVAVPGYAIVGARVVTVSGATIDRATVIIRGGAIEDVKEGAQKPVGVEAIEGQGLTVYPGLIDLATTAGVDAPNEPAPQNPDSREVVERWRRQQLLRAQLNAADLLKADASDLSKRIQMGITNALVSPAGDGVSGQSALVDVVSPEIDPQYGRLAVDPRGAMVLKTPVALHVAMPSRGNSMGVYPTSLMGGIAFVRQAFLDADRYRRTESVTGAAGDRPDYDPAIAAMAGALARRLPVVFEAQRPREIRRALALAHEFSLDPIIGGAQGAGEVAEELRRADARVIVSLDFPQRPKSLAPDADEPLDEIEARAQARRAAGALAAAGVTFGFGSAGMKEIKDFLPAVRAAVRQGLTPDRAIRALTLDAATIAGVGSRLGAVARGRIANLVVCDGDLLGEKTKLKYVFVEGRKVPLEQ
jgi:imidazolonepropionase-like amidohydrolase